MMEHAVWREYLALLNSLGENLEKLSEVEKRKNAAVSRSDLQGLEECMKQEQAMSMTLRGMEQKREKLLAELGLTGVPLRQLEEHSPEELHLEVKETARQLRQRYEVFRSASEVARNTLECNLRAMEKIQQAQAEPEESGQADFRA